MKKNGEQYFRALAAAIFLITILFTAESYGLNLPEKKQQALPFNRLGAEVDQRYGGQASEPVATQCGFKLASKLQALEAEVASGGVTVSSLSQSEGGGQFSITPIAVNGAKAAAGLKPVARSAADGTVTLDRGFVSERFSASADGIRQDFIIAAAPMQTNPGSPATDIVISLAIGGAKVAQDKKDAGAALLTLPSGRKLVYNRLHVTDSQGRELPAQMQVNNTAQIQIIVAAKGATYPITIDPTITDADWTSMNPGIPGVNGFVGAFVFDPSGNLYAAGDFSVAGTVVANKIAKWDGSTWSPLAAFMGGAYDYISTMAVDPSGNLYVGGKFWSETDSINNIAKWDGVSWSALGWGIDGEVHALAFDTVGNLYAGGYFTTAGNVTAKNIAKWDGASWSALGSGIGGDNEIAIVWSLAVDPSGNLYAGGNFFTIAGGITVNHIAKWDGAAWSALGSGVSGRENLYVHALVVDQSGNLYAGGGFDEAGGVKVNHIAKWDGTSWSALGSGMTGGDYTSVQALALDPSGNLYAGGAFVRAAGVKVNNIAKWDGASWSALGSGMDRSVYALAVDTSGNLYAGGYFFTIAGGITVNHIAKWDGASWLAIGSGIDSLVLALAVDPSGNLYAGGMFTTAGSVTANHIAKWDGASWSALGSGVSGAVHALAVDTSGNLYAGGYFTTAGGVTVNHIAKWDGASWSALGSGIWKVDKRHNVTALAFDPSGNLYVGGRFTVAGRVWANNIAKWNGSAWSALDRGLNDTVNDLAVDASGNVYVGGRFTKAGNVKAAYIAKWNGTQWSPLGVGIGEEPSYSFWDIFFGSSSYVSVLAIDASGHVYAGLIDTFDSVPTATTILKWDGASWSALGSKMDGDNFSVNALEVDASGNLYAGGYFTTAGNVAAKNIAKWDGASWSALGSGVIGGVLYYTAAVYALSLDPSGNLYAGGDFTTAGGKFSPYIARCKVSSGQ